MSSSSSKAPKSRISEWLKRRSKKERWLLAVAIPIWTIAGFKGAGELVELFLRVLLALGVPLQNVNATLFGLLGNVFVYLLAILIVFGLPYLVFKIRTTTKDLALDKNLSWWDLVLAPLSYIGYYLLSMVVVMLGAAFLPFVDLKQAQDVGFSNLILPFELFLAFIALVVIAPIVEEILFRGYMLGNLLKLVPTWVAVIVTSAVFAAMHGQWNVALDTFALSIVLCLLRIRTNSLWPAILVHMIKNGIAYYLLFINPTLLSTLGG